MMAGNLYNVKFKIGKRSWTSKIYSHSAEFIIAFFNEYFECKVVSISQIVYDVENTVTIPPDDKSKYKPTMYFMVANNDEGKASQLVFQTIKNTKRIQEVFEGMKQYLMIDDTSDIKSLLNVNESSK